jgi:hypothetical protein
MEGKITVSQGRWRNGRRNRMGEKSRGKRVLGLDALVRINVQPSINIPL